MTAMGEKKSEKKILIVDDDEGTCETLSDILKNKGFKVRVVKSGEECLKRLGKDSFDTLLIDIKMPGMNGVETLQRIKRIDSSVRAIIMTAYAVNDIVDEARKYGVSDVVHKPLDLDSLISLLKE